MFTTAERFVDDSKHNRTPKFDGTKLSRFMQDVMDATATWLSAAQEGASGSAAVFLYGAPAAAVVFKKVSKAQKDKCLTAVLPEVHDLRVFGWLWSATEREAV